jgi:hypothetical protein
MANAMDAAEAELPPPGSRWGTGAQSVLPYLTKSLQAKPATAGGAEQRDREALAARESRPAQPAA